MDDGGGEGQSLTPFGAEMRRRHFLFDEDYVNLNHGSFGTYPSAVRKQLQAFQDAAEARPDVFIRDDVPVRLDASRELLARLLCAPTSEIVLVPNATTGVNTVLRNLTYAPGDAIVYFSSIYGSCEKTILYLCEITPVRAERIEVVHPAEDDAVVGLLRAKLGELAHAGRRPRVVLFDTVVSMPGIRMPFEELTEVVRKEGGGALSLIDGAHGVGHVDLDLGKLNADFFVSNCHKYESFRPPSTGRYPLIFLAAADFSTDGSSPLAPVPSSTSPRETSI
ncbi:hypothetical protein GP486_008435 [Trichoglossum hirsutum]|uniref:Aminotransferase class V domain-containing protein n=1 Tax=Trichoglossum hirsutum TaxID=265104 RepID=A0A9P8IDE3_9PEZI|nr:hypothetical protein GP486_008435 [Trichoglossum hirsutum]